MCAGCGARTGTCGEVHTPRLVSQLPRAGVPRVDESQHRTRHRTPLTVPTPGSPRDCPQVGAGGGGMLSGGCRGRQLPVSGFHLSLCANAEGRRLSRGNTCTCTTEVGPPLPPQPWSSLSCPSSAPHRGRREGLVCGAVHHSLPLALSRVGKPRCGRLRRVSLQVLLFVQVWGFFLPFGASLQTHYRRQNKGSSTCLGTALYAD